MKRIAIIFTLVLAAIVFTSCEKESLIPNDHYPVVLDISLPITGYANAYFMKGENSYFQRGDSIFANYALARLYTDNYFEVGDMLTGMITLEDSIQYTGYKSIFWSISR